MHDFILPIFVKGEDEKLFTFYKIFGSVLVMQFI